MRRRKEEERYEEEGEKICFDDNEDKVKQGTCGSNRHNSIKKQEKFFGQWKKEMDLITLRKEGVEWLFSLSESKGRFYR